MPPTPFCGGYFTIFSWQDVVKPLQLRFFKEGKWSALMVILSGGNCVRVPIANNMEERGRDPLVNRKLIPLSQKQGQAICRKSQDISLFLLQAPSC